VCVFFLYTCVWIEPCSVLDSLISKNAISPFFSFSIVNMIPSVVLLMVSKTFFIWSVFIMENVSSIHSGPKVLCACRSLVLGFLGLA